MTWVHQKCSSRTRGSPSRAFGSRVQWPPCVICQRDVRKACVRHGCPSRRRITMTKRLIIILLKSLSHTTTLPSKTKSFYLTGEPAHLMPKYRPWHPRHTAIETHEWPFPFQSDLYRRKQFRTHGNLQHGTCELADTSQGSWPAPESRAPPTSQRSHLAGSNKRALPTNSLTINTFSQHHAAVPAPMHTHTHTHTGSESATALQRAESSVLTFLSLFFASFLSFLPSLTSNPHLSSGYWCWGYSSRGTVVCEWERVSDPAQPD